MCVQIYIGTLAGIFQCLCMASSSIKNYKTRSFHSSSAPSSTYGAFFPLCCPPNRLLCAQYCTSEFLRCRSIYDSSTSSRSSGVLKPGEMCLVLGCPGSGCTTFLKTIANQRETFANVSGEVLYAGMDAQEMAKYYKGETVYNQEGRWLALLD